MLNGIFSNAGSAMNAMSTDLGTISQNISNMNTTGYKAETTSFRTVMSEQVNKNNDGSGASPTGLAIFGVGAYNRSNNTAVGSMQTTNLYSDIAINGQGFFMVAPPTPTGVAPAAAAVSANTLYTRSGAFNEIAADGKSQTSARYFVNGSGDYLLGWEGANGKVTPGGDLTPISIPQPTQVVRNGVTTTVDMVASPTTTATLLGNISPDNRSKLTNIESLPVTAYDAVSQSHPFTLQFSPITSSTVTTTTTDTSTNPPTVTGPTTTNQTNVLNPNSWNLTFASSESGATVTSVPTTTTTTSTTTNGTLTTDTQTSLTQGVPVTFNADGSIASPSTVVFTATWANGQTSSVTVDISGLTQFGGGGKTVLNSAVQNGYLDGQIQSLAFNGNGVLQGNYTNGQQMDLAQVAVARFPSANTLQTVSGTMFKQTVSSGVPVIDTPSNLGTAIEGATLESSTTDLGTEMSNMILAQKAYGMNSEVFKTGDQMTQTARDLKS